MGTDTTDGAVVTGTAVAVVVVGAGAVVTGDVVLTGAATAVCSLAARRRYAAYLSPLTASDDAASDADDEAPLDDAVPSPLLPAPQPETAKSAKVMQEAPAS